MRVLIWSPNYAPEYMGIPPLVTDAAEWLADRGDDVMVVTAHPNYPERIIHEQYRGRLWAAENRNGVEVRRAWLRVRPQERFLDKALYALSFTLTSLPLIARNSRNRDVVVVVVPALLAAMSGVLLTRARRFVGSDARVVLWIQDLVLDASASVIQSLLQRIAVSSVRALERRVLPRADGVVVCSPGFVHGILDAGVDSARVHTVLNWVDLDEYAVRPISNGPTTRFLYAGNIGFTQGLETLVSAAAELRGEDVHVEIVGDGNAAGTLRRAAESVPNVDVLPSVPRSAAPELLSRAHVHMVVQRRVAANVNFPSKIATCLASGRAVIGSVGEDTPASDVLHRSGAAVLVPPESPSLLAEAMLRLHRDPGARASLGESGRRFAESNLSKDTALRTFWEVARG